MTLRTHLHDSLASSSAAPRLLVVTDNHAGAMLAADMAPAADVHLVTDRPGLAARTPDSVRTTVGDLTARETLGADDAAAVAVVALSRDRAVLLVTQLLRTRLDVASLVVLLNDPERREAVADLATTVVCGSGSLAAALGDAVGERLPGPESPHS